MPRHNCCIGEPEEAISRSVLRRGRDDLRCEDCCIRVFRRSAGWRRTAEQVPETRPAR